MHTQLVRSARVEANCPQCESEYVDVASESVGAQFIVGADGADSTVRDQLGIEWLSRGDKQFYVFFEAPDERDGSDHSACRNGALVLQRQACRRLQGRGLATQGSGAARGRPGHGPEPARSERLRASDHGQQRR